MCYDSLFLSSLWTTRSYYAHSLVFPYPKPFVRLPLPRTICPLHVYVLFPQTFSDISLIEPSTFFLHLPKRSRSFRTISHTFFLVPLLCSLFRLGPCTAILVI